MPFDIPELEIIYLALVFYNEDCMYSDKKSKTLEIMMKELLEFEKEKEKSYTEENYPQYYRNPE